MITRPACDRRFDVFEAQLCQLEFVDEGIDRANRIALVDPVIEAFRQQRRLTANRAFNEPSHRPPPEITGPIVPDSSFSRSQGQEGRFAASPVLLLCLR